MSKPSRPDVAGPLAPYVAGFERDLARLGYSSSTASAHLYLMAHVSRLLVEHALAPGELCSSQVEQFLVDRRADGHVRRRTARGLIPLLGYLRGPM